MEITKYFTVAKVTVWGVCEPRTYATVREMLHAIRFR
jgi:hypothetical protein